MAEMATRGLSAMGAGRRAGSHGARKTGEVAQEAAAGDELVEGVRDLLVGQELLGVDDPVGVSCIGQTLEGCRQPWQEVPHRLRQHLP